MAIDISFRDTYSTSARDLSRLAKNFLINEGVVKTGLVVSQSDIPAMSVKVASGSAYFYGSGSYSNVMYEFESDSVESVNIPIAGVQPRIDIICLKVDTSTQVASIVSVSGTPAPVTPAVPATPASHYKLAEVAVGAGVTQITNANITDKRKITSLALESYPVGAIYISTINTNPSSIFGGTWTAFGSGRTLVGVDTGQTEFDTVEETGGSKTHTLTTSEMPSHTHSSTGLSTNSTGAHTHNYEWGAGTASGSDFSFMRPAGFDNSRATTSAGSHSHTISGDVANTGGGTAHNNLQPYITVYFWKRTA